MMGLASAKVSSVTNSSLSSSKTSAQALQYAETQADIVRNTAYDDLSSKAKTQIAGTHYYEEVTVGAETAYKEDIKKKDCIVNVYSGNETIPRATLTITSVTSTHYGTVQHQSNGLGELQGDAIRNIYGRFVVDDIVGNGGYNRQYSPNGAFKVVGSAYYDARSHESWNGCLVSFNTSYVVPTANEDRPINRAVRYFIKAA